MNCPDCDTPMMREDVPPDGGWPQISYRCPVCHPVGLDVTEDADYGRPQNDVPTRGKL